MTCEKCKKKIATVHLTEIIKGVKSEVHLCEDCAREIGLNSKLSNFSLTIPDFLSFLNDDSEQEFHAPREQAVCRRCGTTVMKRSVLLKAGCPHCYIHLKDAVHERLVEIGGSTFYSGRRPDSFIPISAEEVNSFDDIIDEENDILWLKGRLDDAVKNEEYEQAAQLRDKIRELEQIVRE